MCNPLAFYRVNVIVKIKRNLFTLRSKWFRLNTDIFQYVFCSVIFLHSLFCSFLSQRYLLKNVKYLIKHIRISIAGILISFDIHLASVGASMIIDVSAIETVYSKLGWILVEVAPVHIKRTILYNDISPSH